MLYIMSEDDGNGNGDGVDAGLPGNPYISGKLCIAYRETMRSENQAMEEKILFSIKITGAAIALVVTIVQLGLYFFGV